MRIKSVEFAGAIGAPGGKPPGTLPQVTFSGRSNVGKSSLINRLLGRTRTQLARVSATPGKTQEINFYLVRAGIVPEAEAEPSGGAEAGPAGGPGAALAEGDRAAAEQELSFYLVDLPGYGFARVPKELRARWRPLIESYLRSSPDLLGVVQLIDARHGPTPDDERMLEFLAALETPTMVVLTKADKLGRNERGRAVSKILDKLHLDADQAILFSATTGEGREELLAALGGLLEGAETAPEGSGG